MRSPARPKLLRCCPQEQEPYTLVGCVILNGESRYLRPSRLWIVVVNELLFGGPKLRRRTPLQPSHRRYAPASLPDDPAQVPTVNSTAHRFFSLFSPKSFQPQPPDCLNPTSTQPATSDSNPRHLHSVQAKPQAQMNGHR